MRGVSALIIGFTLRRFHSSFDARTQSISVLASAVVLIVVVLTGTAAQSNGSLLFASISVTLALFVVLLFALSPNGVEVGDDSVHIRQRWGGIQRNLADLSSVRRIEVGELRSSVRLVSVGGVFGWFGTFQSPKLGEFKMFATRLDRLILMEFHGERIVVSVDEPDRLLAILQVQVDVLD